MEKIYLIVEKQCMLNSRTDRKASNLLFKSMIMSYFFSFTVLYFSCLFFIWKFRQIWTHFQTGIFGSIPRSLVTKHTQTSDPYILWNLDTFDWHVSTHTYIVSFHTPTPTTHSIYPGVRAVFMFPSADLQAHTISNIARPNEILERFSYN